MNRTIMAILTLSLLLMSMIAAVDSPYAGLEARDIKALSEQQIADYLGGKGMGLALPGELNGYPGPKHVLELSEQLELSDGQHARVVQIFEGMQYQAKLLGERIVAAEGQLDAAFADGAIDLEGLRTITVNIGRLQGELRAVHLQAHLDTKDVLAIEQVHRYGQLRGYGHGDGHHSHMKHNGHSG